jgi:hypothetical protein
MLGVMSVRPISSSIVVMVAGLLIYNTCLCCLVSSNCWFIANNITLDC